MSTPTALIAGDRYELRQLIGQGGFGAVYRAFDRETGLPVAVKVLSLGATKDPERIERMVREQQAMVALAGKGAVAALDLCELPNGQLCLIMEWLEGEDLEQHLNALEDRGERLSHTRLIEIMAAVTDTLDRAHQMGIVHRDIKPANIFLSDGAGSIRLLDFGLSRMRWSKTLTQTGMVMGSPSYIAPETWRAQTLDHRVDLFALGVVVFRALTGHVPFAGSSLVEQMMLVTQGPRPSPRQFRAELPASLDRWVEQALAIDPKQRFPNASSLHQALVGALGGEARGAQRARLPETLEELQGAIASAWGAATSLLKRVAGLASVRPPAGNVQNAMGEAPTAATLGESPGEAQDRSSYVGDWLAGSELIPRKVGPGTLLGLDTTQRLSPVENAPAPTKAKSRAKPGIKKAKRGKAGKRSGARSRKRRA